jgi:hypothetical protein
VLVAVGGQLVVPPIATELVRHRLGKDGRVISARLSAFPWLQLLWQHADSLSAKLADYRVAPGRIEELLHEAEGIDRLDVSIGVVRTGALTLRDVSLDKRGDELVGVAQLSLQDLREALPIIRSLRPVHDGRGQVVLRGEVGMLGVSAPVEVSVAAREGRLMVAPTGPLGMLATLTLYDDPRLRVQSVSATTVPGGLRFEARGRAA